jgi:hypothetical protein
MIADDDGRGRREIALVQLGDLLVPAFLAGLGLE